jgi:hypothetical protein
MVRQVRRTVSQPFQRRLNSTAITQLAQLPAERIPSLVRLAIRHLAEQVVPMDSVAMAAYPYTGMVVLVAQLGRRVLDRAPAEMV